MIKTICRNALGQQFNEKNYLNLRFDDRIIKFQVNKLLIYKNRWKKCIFSKVLRDCIAKFQHNIPNTTLNDINTISDLVDYFKLEVQDTNPLEELHQRPDLPKNLTIDVEYTRFDPKNDTFFNGADAFPDRNTYTSSLWYSKKYKPIYKKKEYFKK